MGKARAVVKGAQLVGNAVQSVLPTLKEIAKIESATGRQFPIIKQLVETSQRLPNLRQIELLKQQYPKLKISPYSIQREIGLLHAPYGYDRSALAQQARQILTEDNILEKRPFLYKALQSDQKLQDALNSVLSGTSEVRMAPGYRTLLQPNPESILTATRYAMDNPVVYGFGSGYVGTRPIKGLTGPLSGKKYIPQKESNFGDMISLTDMLEGGTKYGFRDWESLEHYLRNEAHLGSIQQKYVSDLISRMKNFENKVEFVYNSETATTDGNIFKPSTSSIKKLFGNEEAFNSELKQYLLDQEELSLFLGGNLEHGAKNQQMLFPSFKSDSIIIAQSDNPNFGSVKSKVDDLLVSTITGDDFTKLSKRKLGNILNVEQTIGKYNSSPQDQKLLLKDAKDILVFPLHLRSYGPNPVSGMTTLGASWAIPVWKKGNKLIRRKK